MSLTRKETRIIKVVKRTLNVVQKARIPFRSSKFSNHIYNNHVHMVLLILKVRFDMSYPDFMDMVASIDEIWVILGVNKVPHFTTIHKFAGRLGRYYLDRLLAMSSTDVNIRVLVTGIDSTGFALTNASVYYTTVINYRRKKKKVGRPRTRRAIKRYLKTTLVTELRAQMVLALTVRRGPDNDNKDFKPSYKKVAEIDSRRLKMAIADKGYDSEENHRYIRKDLNAETIIPARKKRSPNCKTRGKYRREMRRGYSKKIYNQRNKSETVNSVIKRKMGSDIRARKCKYQNREIYFKAIAYNIERGLILFIYIGFLRSHFVVILI